jgi:methyl acetate hydrolase
MAETVRTTTRIDEVLNNAVERGDVPGVVAMAANADGPIYEGAAGEREAGTGDPITPDTMLRIASMTKMVATTAALQLVEQGKLDLDAPVDTPRLRAPASRATVRQLVTHTTGLGYWFFNADIDRYEQVTGVPNVLPGSDEVFKSPLIADPGDRLEYGINTDRLGRVVEAVSGQSLADYIDEHITGPLGMTNTTRRMSDEQRANSTPIHVRGENGAWTPTDIDWAQEPDFWGGGHFLYSTPRDYLRFQRMLLGGGTLEGVQILESSTVDDAFRNHIGDLYWPPSQPTAHPELSAQVDLGPGLKWGLGLLLNEEQAPGMRAPMSGAWAGLFNTHFWVDPTTRVTGSIFSQVLPFADPPALQMYADYEQALYASL